jgi:hypothetical protein
MISRASPQERCEAVADQFDPNNIAQGAQQQATEKADSLIDELASKVPGGDQLAQQAKDAVNQAVQSGTQQAEQAAQQQAGGLADKLPGGLGEQLGGMLGGSGGAGGSGDTGGSSGSGGAQ